MDEVRVLGYCAECGNEITDDVSEYYCDSNGDVLCSYECVLEHCGVTTVEV